MKGDTLVLARTGVSLTKLCQPVLPQKFPIFFLIVSLYHLMMLDVMGRLRACSVRKVECSFQAFGQVTMMAQYQKHV